MLKRYATALLAALLVFTAFSVFAQEEVVDVDGLMKNFFAASTDEEKSKAVSLLRFSGIDAAKIESRLKKGRAYEKEVATGWQVLENKCTDGKERPYHLYVPEDYDPDHKYPLLYDLHGGISRPSIVPVEMLKSRYQLWGPSAKEKDFLLIIPHGEGSATWWSKVGSDNILQQLDYVKRHYNVDENKVFLSGFSDGGSGSYWMAFHRPTAFAGFIPLSGNMVVPRAGPYQCYPKNLGNRPIHATNGGRDSLYPSATMKQYVEKLNKAGADIDWKDYPEAGHDLGYMGEEIPRCLEFIGKTARDPKYGKIHWRTADTEAGRCDWVVINEIKDVGNNANLKLHNLTSAPGRLILGVVIDQSYQGNGVRIQQVQKGSVANGAGLSGGDIITKLDDTDIGGITDLQKVLRGKKHGDTIKGEYERGGQTGKFNGSFPEFKSEVAFKREKTTAAIEVKADGNKVDVKAMNVARFTLLINSDMFNIDEPVIVTLNGKEVGGAKVERDMVFMLERCAEDNDREMVYCAKIEVEVPSKEKQDKEEEE